MGVRSSISSIKIKLFLAFFLLAVFVIAMVSYTLYAHMRTDHLNTLKNGMIKLVEIAAASIDGDTVKQINEKSGEDNPAYPKLKQFLRSIVEKGKGTDQVFIVKKSELTGQYIYLADTKADGAAEADFGDWLDTNGWSEFNGNIDKMAVYQSGADELLALAPLHDSQGKVIAVLGIKSDPDKVAAEFRHFGWEIVKTGAKATLIVLSISWLLAYKFTQRIRRIDKAIEQITTG